uniref:Uncharacterized protein n=1 Tax=Pipistrellus kuhlii TaxID=59472 RepID=A0A7J7UTF7_PIPKU|nr:hypothetical protein mPipKuh1_008683 [Pipistrellus kuhlii]
MGLERQDVRWPTSPCPPDVGSRPFAQEPPVESQGQAAPRGSSSRGKAPACSPCPRALTAPALGYCWATTPPMALFTIPSSRPALPLPGLHCPSARPPSQQPGRYNHTSTKRSFAALSCFLPKQRR